MKRLVVIITVFIVSATAVFAKPPHLAVENLFDGRFNNTNGVTTSIYKNKGNYYRGLTVKGNERVLDKVAEAIEKDRSRGIDYSDFNDDSGRYISLKIVNNGATIFIGLQREKTGEGFFFIQGKEEAFK